MTTYGVCNHSGFYIEVSKTLLGAKQYATRNEFTAVYVSYYLVNNITLKSEKIAGKWRDS